VSDPLDLQSQLLNMTNLFKLRNYPEQILNGALVRLNQVNRDTLFKYKVKTKKTDRPILVLIYENRHDKKNVLKRTLYKLWKELISENPYLQRYFKEIQPMLAFKNGRNIKQTLISTKFPAPWHIKQELEYNNNTLDKENLHNLLALLSEC
jgi:hypothetical protein